MKAYERLLKFIVNLFSKYFYFCLFFLLSRNYNKHRLLQKTGEIYYESL